MEQNKAASGLKEGAIEYLIRLEKPEGGFSFALTAPPAIKDTLYATLSLRLLGVSEAPGNATINWVAKEPFHPEAPISTVAAQAKLYRLFDLPIPQKEIELRVHMELEGPLSPSKLFHLGVVVKNAHLDHHKPKIEELSQGLNIHPQRHDTSETLYYKAAMRGKHHHCWREAIGDWLRGCRNGDGGYGCRPDTTSFLEHIYWATRLMELAEINLSEEERETTLQFVLGSQSRRGGFGRAPEGVPFIDSTYYALWILKFLGQL